MPIAAHLLGPPLMVRDGVVYAPPKGKKVWALFAYLVLSERQPTRPQLIELLFPDAEDPAGALRWNLSELRRLLGGATPRVRVYASGLNPDRPADLAATRRTEGFRAFKLKIGFGKEHDLANIGALRSVLGDGVDLMVDANQAWPLDMALDMAAALEPFYIGWLEEPLRADRPWSEWQTLRDHTSIPLAAGENLAGDASFDAALAANVLKVVQPDVAKWGGFSKGIPLARRIVAAGARFCPHWLGGGIGLLASAHALAAVGGGMLEVDANPNPLRSATCGPLAGVSDGYGVLNNRPGLGIEPDLAGVQAYAVAL